MNIIRHITDWLKEQLQCRKINEILRSEDIKWSIYYPTPYGILHPHKGECILQSTNLSGDGSCRCVHSKKLVENVYELILETDENTKHLTLSGNKVYLVQFNDRFYFVVDFLVQWPNFWEGLWMTDPNEEYLVSTIQQAKEFSALNEAMKTGVQHA